MDFYENLKALSTTPSSRGREKSVGKIIRKELEGYVDNLTEDNIGNLYALRKGSKKTWVVLSAHQDKINDCFKVGYAVEKIESLDSNLIFESAAAFEYALNNTCFIEEGQEYLPIKLEKPRTFAEIPIIREIPYRASMRGDIFDGDSDDDFCEYNKKEMEKLYIPIGLNLSSIKFAKNEFKGIYSGVVFREDENYVHGKLDNTTGIALIIELLHFTKSEETPSIMALFTVGEETGMAGARFASKNILSKALIDRLIVLDNTRAEKPGSGIVLYKNCGFDAFNTSKNRKNKNWEDKKESLKEPLVKELEDFAKERGINLTTHNAAANDSRVFACETGIKTVALEVPVENMHSCEETAAKADINLMRKFLYEYLTK